MDFSVADKLLLTPAELGVGAVAELSAVCWNTELVSATTEVSKDPGASSALDEWKDTMIDKTGTRE